MRLDFMVVYLFSGLSYSFSMSRSNSKNKGN